MAYKVRVTVDEVLKDECPMEFKPGDNWLIEDGKTPGGMCASAFTVLSPTLRHFRLGGEHPWDEDKDVTFVSCPDPKCVLIYKLERLHE